MDIYIYIYIYIHLFFHIYIYICIYRYSPNKDARQGRGSHLVSIVIPLESRILECQVPKPRCLSPVANSLDSRIAGLDSGLLGVRCLSPAA